MNSLTFPKRSRNRAFLQRRCVVRANPVILSMIAGSYCLS
jgi:hypothetical protein